MNPKVKRSIKFSVIIAVITFVLAAIFSVISSSILGQVMWGVGLGVVFVIVLIGIFFDMLGVASTAANEAPLHAMAAEKVPGAKEAVIIIRNADKFSSFCNDVIGDISGIVSGTASAIVVLEIADIFQSYDETTTQIIVSVLLTSFVAAVTVGGKALGKYFAIRASTNIVFSTGKFIAFVESKFKLRLLPKGK
ncbi:MAG TPA: hypothetical protein VK144_07165 [Bacillota bacterium]|nr:hypothetical protein [Bacillota bacterium]